MPRVRVEVVMMQFGHETATVEGVAGCLTHTGGSAVSSAVPAAYVPEVDALRCLAMTAVIAIHCGLFPLGWMGVWLFFVVSGFAVTTSLFSAKHNALGVWHRIGTFYVRRALRIWPLYFIFVAANVIVILALGNYSALQEVPWLVTFTQNIKMIIESYAPGTAWNGFAHLWTLSTEQQFYLAFPILLLLPSRRSRTLVLLGVIVAAPLIRYGTGCWAVAYGFDDLRAAFAVYAFGPAHFDAFAIGTLIAMYRHEITQNRRLAPMAAILALAITAIYTLTYMLINFTLIGGISVNLTRNILSGIIFGQGREIWAYFVPVCVSGAILVGILAGDPRCLRVCRLPGLQAIGRISYGGYLFHVPVLMILISLVPAFGRPVTGELSYGVHILLFFCAYLITVGAAWLSFTYVERQLSRLGRSAAQ